MKFFIVDAFAKEAFGGNPAGVVLLDQGADFPESELMLKTAAELRYSETAFIKHMGEKEFFIRYFTPASEVELCGHATIASFKVLHSLGLAKDGKSYQVKTIEETVNVQIEDGFVMMKMAEPTDLGEFDSEEQINELYEIMGSKWDSSLIPPRIVKAGLPDIMMNLPSLEALNAMEPNMKALAALSEKYKVTGVHAFTLEKKDGETCHCRNFAPLYDIDEEAATGTASGSLTYHLYLSNVIKSKDTCKMIQGEKMNRPSIISTRIDLEGSSDSAVFVGGSAVILALGEINI